MLAAPGWGSTCGFHNYLPERTVVDRLLDSDHIVLARPGPENPFRYKRFDWVEFPFLVSSLHRHRSAANPSEAVLFARDGAYGPWQQLAYIDVAYRAVLGEVVARMPAWERGDLRDRLQMFADLSAHPDSEVQRLALADVQVSF